MEVKKNSLVTKGLRVSVISREVHSQSNSQENRYVFAYRISIENESSHTVQLLRRRWEILNAYGEKEIVGGEGVIGQQPRLLPGESHVYSSGAQLNTPLGMMKGTYEMINEDSGELFKVRIPEFMLETLSGNN